MGYKLKTYDFKKIPAYIEQIDLSLSISAHYDGGKLEKLVVSSVHARKPIIIEELSSGLFCVYEQHKNSKRHISIHKTYKGVLGRINVLIDRYCDEQSVDDRKRV